MTKFLQILTFALLMSIPLTQVSEAREICANCYWKKSACPTITPDEIIRMELTNKNPDITNSRDKGPFMHFMCDNGSKTLGVEWTDSTCDKIGGLSGIREKDFPGIYDKPECEYGSKGFLSSKNL